MFVNIRMLFIIFWTLAAVQVRFNLETCWGKDCIRQNGGGTWCYFSPLGETRAKWGCRLHHGTWRQGLSIAYYNGVNNTKIGARVEESPTPAWGGGYRT
jgi:hypothetical protein